MLIYDEKPQDREAVFDLIKTAFENEEYSDHTEHLLVERLRKSNAFIPELSLTAKINNQIVGYILFTKITINENILLALAPVAVLPEFQKRGIGSALIKEGDKIAREKGYKGSIVLGHEDYYPKFGYKPASEFGIFAPFEVPDKNFMALELIDNGLKNISGTVKYADEFLI